MPRPSFEHGPDFSIRHDAGPTDEEADRENQRAKIPNRKRRDPIADVPTPGRNVEEQVIAKLELSEDAEGELAGADPESTTNDPAKLELQQAGTVTNLEIMRKKFPRPERSSRVYNSSDLRDPMNLEPARRTDPRAEKFSDLNEKGRKKKTGKDSQLGTVIMKKRRAARKVSPRGK